MLCIILCYASYYTMHHTMLCIILCYASCYTMHHATLCIILHYASYYAMHHTVLCIILYYASYYTMHHTILRIILNYASMHTFSLYRCINFLLCYFSFFLFSRFRLIPSDYLNTSERQTRNQSFFFYTIVTPKDSGIGGYSS